jgi:alkyl hydroperoxide reductase subunit AhpC
MRRYIPAILLMLLPVTAYAAPEIGKPAPDFTATAIDGKSVNPSDYKGKIVVMEWNNPGCPFVHKHYDSGNMQKLQSYAQSKGAVWLTVNSAGKGREGSMTQEQATAYLQTNHAAPTHYINDNDGSIGKLYGAKTTPHMFIIDASGNIRRRCSIAGQRA